MTSAPIQVLDDAEIVELVRLEQAATNGSWREYMQLIETRKVRAIIARLLSERSALIGLLRPFANLAAYYDGADPRNAVTFAGADIRQVTVGDLRAVRDFLARIPAGPQSEGEQTT